NDNRWLTAPLGIVPLAFRAVTQNSARPVEVRRSPDHPPQPTLTTPKLPSSGSTSNPSVAPTPKTGSPIFPDRTGCRDSFACRSQQCQRNFAISHISGFFAIFLPLPSLPFLPPPPPPPPSHNVLESRPDIAGSAHPRCSARSSCLDRLPEDRHYQCGF